MKSTLYDEQEVFHGLWIIASFYLFYPYLNRKAWDEIHLQACKRIC